jgi:Na+/phosphate symporter
MGRWLLIPNDDGSVTDRYMYIEDNVAGNPVIIKSDLEREIMRLQDIISNVNNSLAIYPQNATANQIEAIDEHNRKIKDELVYLNDNLTRNQSILTLLDSEG